MFSALGERTRRKSGHEVELGLTLTRTVAILKVSSLLGIVRCLVSGTPERCVPFYILTSCVWRLALETGGKGEALERGSVIPITSFIMRIWDGFNAGHASRNA